MPLSGITKQGLLTIAILTAIMWACLLTERKLVRYSKMETYRSLRDMRRLKVRRHVEPASRPLPTHRQSTVPAVG